MYIKQNLQNIFEKSEFYGVVGIIVSPPCRIVKSRKKLSMYVTFQLQMNKI